ncbi:hypothetical protein LWI29_037375 [Acer saccharum]|uniref:Uncharacterized protein n=1 Tax=Acer saccharum TaxID=4024 RepID=A0AA39SIJ7_ACESA|nr:hypothetical protein LWI29_037375 [Acer saccharum]
MKFGKEFACQMVPEWQEAYMDYDLLKIFLKEIQWIKQRNKQAAAATRPASLTRALTLYRAYSGLIIQRHKHNHPMMMMSSSPSMKDIESSIVLNSVNRNGSHSYETTFLMANTEDGGEYEQEFFNRLDNEFNKVERFYRFKVQEVMEEAETLSKQMDALIAFRIKALALQEALFDSMSSDDDDDPLDVLDHVELHNTLGTPYSIIRRFVNSTDQQKQVTFNRDTLKKVETKLKRAFIQFYHKIGLLKSYSFLNILAFSKIMKKYDKITSRSESTCYMNMVDNSYIGSSDEVALQDFFLADQLTSQVQAFRSLEFYICYYGWGDYKLRQNTCKTNDVHNTFYIIVAVIPYSWRFLQCIRRVYEEKDRMQGYNAVAYFMTIVAISTRSAYSLYKGMGWKIIAGITSAIAAIYCTYWDLVVDWGLLQRHSKNRWLRDKLLVPCKTVYFAAMVFNVLLRFAWLQTVLDLKLDFLHEETVITVFASLEIIRRGIWNFFRLENEHLNNVGKFRAFKSVPLPFKYYENEDEDGDE